MVIYNVCDQSLCIDTGDPERIDPDGTRSDIGIYFPEHPECVFRDIWYVSVDGSDDIGDGSGSNPYKTIQRAINASYDGDTILVARGFYQENLEISYKDIILTSQHIYSHDSTDIIETIINGDSISRVVNVIFSDNIVINGFTIEDGWIFGFNDNGVGISVSNSNATITNNIIRNNVTTFSPGAGIYCISTNASIKHNVVCNNTTTDSTGGGIAGIGCPSIIIENNYITENTALSGGGIYCYKSEAYISNNDINQNSITYRGGGIYLAEGRNSSLIENNSIHDNNGSGLYAGGSNTFVFSNNVFGNTGGGIRFSNDIFSGRHKICYNSIINNFASDYHGGGIYCTGSHAIVSNNAIIGNSTIGHGGGIYFGKYTISLTNNIIVGNQADSSGGGIYISLDSDSFYLTNAIVRDNAAEISDNEIYSDDDNAIIDYSNITGGWPGDGNIDLDPLFRDPENGDYHLMATACGDPYDSPCIDMGNPDILDNVLSCDWGLGELRSDMGAYSGDDSIAVGIDDQPVRLPVKVRLCQNYPNPFNAATTIKYDIDKPQHIRLEIYNVLGQKICTLVDEYKAAGEYKINWHANDYSSGVYFAIMQSEEISESIKLIMLK